MVSPYSSGESSAFCILVTSKHNRAYFCTNLKMCQMILLVSSLLTVVFRQGRSCICNSELVQFNGTKCIVEDDDDGVSDCLVRVIFFLVTSIISPCIFAVSRFVKADCFNVVLCQHQGGNANDIVPTCFINYTAEGNVFTIPRELHRCLPTSVQESSLAFADVQVLFHAFPFFRKNSAFDGNDIQAYNDEFNAQLKQLRDFIESHHDHTLSFVKFEDKFEAVAEFFDERKSKKQKKEKESIAESQNIAPDMRGVSVITEHFPMDTSLDLEAGNASFSKGCSFKVRPAQAGLKFPEGTIFTY